MCQWGLSSAEQSVPQVGHWLWQNWCVHHWTWGWRVPGLWPGRVNRSAALTLQCSVHHNWWEQADLCGWPIQLAQSRLKMFGMVWDRYVGPPAGKLMCVGTVGSMWLSATMSARCRILDTKFVTYCCMKVSVPSVIPRCCVPTVVICTVHLCLHTPCSSLTRASLQPARNHSLCIQMSWLLQGGSITDAEHRVQQHH